MTFEILKFHFTYIIYITYTFYITYVIHITCIFQITHHILHLPAVMALLSSGGPPSPLLALGRHERGNLAQRTLLLLLLGVVSADLLAALAGRNS